MIPGNMADAAFIVRGKGVAKSLNSASHGAGRRMSRTAARNQFNWRMWRDYLAQRRVRLLAGGIESEGNPDSPGALIDLVSPEQATEYWVGFQNFYVITRYNRSSFYAMAVFQLAEAIRERRQAL